MQLSNPFCISAGLYPAIKIGNAFLECREALRFFVVWDDSKYQINGFRPGAFADLQSCFSAILSFFSAWNDAIDYSKRSGRESENLDLFDTENERLKNWAQENSDEISFLSYEIEENEDLIIE